MITASVLSGCQSRFNSYFFSPHMYEYEKAPFLHELVYAVHLNKESQLLYKLYGSWGYSLTPLDLDQKLNGTCIKQEAKRGRLRERRDLAYYNFFSDVFDQDIHIMNRKENDCGYEKYLDEFYKYPAFNDAVHLALIRFQQIAERLEALYFNKLDLIDKYDNIDHLTQDIDQDMASLSLSGYHLAESTKTFFKLAKQQLAMQDVANARSSGLMDLSSFSNSLAQVKKAQFETIEEATLATIEALEELQHNINR